MDDNDCQGVDKFEPRGMVGRIYVGDHWTLLYIKYISCGPELNGGNSDGSLTF